MSGVIRELADGLVMRRARVEDADELAEFNIRNHSDDLDEPDTGLGVWTRNLLSGRHPTVGPDDITVVVDESAGGKIVSTCVLISQRWRLEDVEFGVGRPELIATDPEYRRRGLVREQMEVMHEWSAARGEVVQAITGIPWYYRKFGYEMTLDLGGGARFFWEKAGNWREVKEEEYRMRPATAADIPVVSELYETHARSTLVAAVRDDAVLAWEIEGGSKDTMVSRRYHLVEDLEGEVVGYVSWAARPPAAIVYEMAVRPGVSLRAVALFLTRWLKPVVTEEFKDAKKKIVYPVFAMGREHPVYVALGKQLEPPYPPYKWYIRVPDVRGFLRLLAPVLERRLADSVMSGHTGTLKVNLYDDHFSMVFEKGRLEEIGSWEPKNRLAEGDVRFPDLTMLQVIFGSRSLEELSDAFADAYPSSGDAAILTDILFPKRASQVLALS